MKQTLLILSAALVLVFGMNSCREDIVVTGNFVETPIVYGLLDQSDTVHIIKITRAFIGPGNSLEISQIPDSSYFQNVSATVTERLANGTTGRVWQLFDSIVDTKETNGVFYAPEQKVYAFYTGAKDNSASPTNQDLIATAQYDLNIIIDGGTSKEFQVSGSTDIVTGISTNTDSQNYQFKFAKNAAITGEYNNSGMIVANGNAAIVNSKLIIDYKEFIGADSVIQTFEWSLGELEVVGSNTNFSMQGESFYNLIVSNTASADPNVTRRNLDGITVQVVGGSFDLYNYILINQPSSSIAQNKPTFTNLTATGDHPVLGLFSSRFTKSVYHPMSISSSQNIRCIDRNSTAELCIGPITGLLNFCSQQQQDVVLNQPWACP